MRHSLIKELKFYADSLIKELKFYEDKDDI